MVFPMSITIGMSIVLRLDRNTCSNHLAKLDDVFILAWRDLFPIIGVNFWRQEHREPTAPPLASDFSLLPRIDNGSGRAQQHEYLLFIADSTESSFHLQRPGRSVSSANR